MGYELHIERDDAEIPLVEWEAYVERAADLHMEPYVEATSPAGDSLRIEGPFAVWTRDGDVGARFRFSHGRVHARAGDAAMITRMQQIAAELGARVRGDDGEPYDEPVKPDGGEPDDEPVKPDGGLLKRLFRRG